MRSLLILIISFVMLQVGFAGTYENLMHDTPAPVLMGETVRLELNHLNPNDYLYNARFFYRSQGEADYQSLPMRLEGLHYTVDLPTKNLQPGNVEYYFAFQSDDGTPMYYPESAPFTNALNLSVVPEASAVQQGNQLDIMLLSPEPDELLAPEDIFVAFSIPYDESMQNEYQYRLLIGGVEVTRLLEVEDNLITFAPNSIRSGLHNAEFKVLDAGGNIVGTKEFSFRISSTPSDSKGFNSRGNVFVDNRYQDISTNSRNIFRGGISFYGDYKKLDFLVRTLISSEEAGTRQPVNQYTAQLRYNFSPTFYMYLKGGDVSSDFDPLVLWGKRIRGIGAGLKVSFFGLDYLYGQSMRGIEGAADSSGTGTSRYGTFEKSFLGIRPYFEFGDHVEWGLNLVNGKDDPNSIKHGANPKESLVMGSTLRMNFDKRRINFSGSFQASTKNENARGKVSFDTLAERFGLEGSDRDLAEQLYSFYDNTGFLTTSQGLSPIPSIAMQIESSFRYFGHHLRVVYKKIEADYVTAGNPYLLRDLSGLFIYDNIRLLSNQVFLNIHFKSYDDNISKKDLKTSNVDVGGSLSYFPFSNLPSITLSYNNISRENELAKSGIHPDSTFYLLEDNKTQNIGFSTSYNFFLGKVRNTASVNISNFVRDDAAYSFNQSDYTVFTVGLRNQYGFPMTSRVSYSQTSSKFGKDITETSTDIQKIYLYLDYIVNDFIQDGDLRPYISFNYQNIDNSVSATGAYNRINYTAGLYFRAMRYGNLTLRFDYIDFGDQVNWKDTILSTRYELNF